jgi:hypothetical protein
MFVNLASYDLNLEVGSPCIDRGSDPGTSGTQSLAPTFEYVHPLSEDVRVVVGAAIDIGAYEYGNPADASTGGGPSTDGRDGGNMNDASVMSTKASSGCGCGLVGASPDARLAVLGATMLAMAMLGRGRAHRKRRGG